MKKTIIDTNTLTQVTGGVSRGPSSRFRDLLASRPSAQPNNGLSTTTSSLSSSATASAKASEDGVEMNVAATGNGFASAFASFR